MIRIPKLTNLSTDDNTDKIKSFAILRPSDLQCDHWPKLQYWASVGPDTRGSVGPLGATETKLVDLDVALPGGIRVVPDMDATGTSSRADWKSKILDFSIPQVGPIDAHKNKHIYWLKYFFRSRTALENANTCFLNSPLNDFFFFF